jgi:hypothetical protein
MRTPGLKTRWIGWGIPAILFLSVPAFAQSTKQLETRECKAAFDDSLARKKPERSKKSKTSEVVPVASQSCLDIRYPALMIQERLQKYVREQRWDISDEHISEDTWTLSRFLSMDELNSYTKPPALPKIAWHGGKAWIQVRTNELPDGFTRVVLSARFDGYGTAQDQFAAQRESWPLPSSGTLESVLLSELRFPSAVPSSQL